MGLLLSLTYAAACIAIFTILRIPRNRWTVPTAAIGGILLVVASVLVMNHYHPYTDMSRRHVVTMPIVPEVGGEVVEVAVSENQLLDKGDVLFRIDRAPFLSRIRLQQARVEAARSEVARAEQRYQTDSSAGDDLGRAVADLEDRLARLAQAEYDLEQTTVRAPTDGYATRLALSPGMQVSSLPLSPVMLFVSGGDHNLIAWFRENSLLRLEAGDDAEVAFDGIPGKVFAAEVQLVLPALADGLLPGPASLVDPAAAPRQGRIPVLLNITDPDYKRYASELPGGSHAQAAVYGDKLPEAALMRKILLRMSAWMNYLFPLA